MIKVPDDGAHAMNSLRSCAPRRQRGAAALAVSMILLFCMTLVIFFVNRSMLFEQKASANQLRSTRAFEVADAGLEWATARLNDRGQISNLCVTTAGQPSSFREIYVPVAGTPSNLTPPANARAACRVGATGALSCTCPAPGTALALAASTDPSFSVLFEDEPGDIEAVRVTAFGCVNQTGVCAAGATAGGDAAAVTRVTLKLAPVLRAGPAAALTTGGWAQVCGSFNITNQSTNANGYLVNSGGQTQIGNGTYLSGTMPPGAPNCGGGGGQTLSTTPGTPIASAVVANDTSLSTITGSADAMFAAFFGRTLGQYQSASTTCTITGNNAGSRATNLINAYNSTSNPCRMFWVDGDIQFSGNGTLGGPNDAVMIVSSSNMTFNGNYDIYGVIYSDSANWNALGTGTSRVFAIPSAWSAIRSRSVMM